MRLGDGNQASVGDVIITRSNDRRLRLTATDWVKNGDRWTITRIGRRGDLTVRHNRSQLTVRLPADYVRDLDRSRLRQHHPFRPRRLRRYDARPATGQESRQQLYTMLTRGRHANHLYLQVVGDGDPHTVIRPDTISPRTPTETLQQILARDEAPPPPAPCCANSTTQPPGCTTRSSATPTASTSQPNSSSDPKPSQSLTKPTNTSPDSPRTRLANPASPPARPRSRNRQHPLRHLLTAASGRDLRTAGDMAAVLYWRLPELTPTNPGPLPWLLGHSTNDSMPILSGASTWHGDPKLVADLADQVQDHAYQGDAPPVWAPPGSHPSTTLVREIAVWRAANRINPQDPRPTGGTQLETLPALWKQHLDRDIARATTQPADARADERQAGRIALSSYRREQHQYQTPERRPGGPSAPRR